MPLRLMAVHAHPDDECISTGGILARYSAEGARTVLVTCTGGEVGEIADPALATPENLGEVRARELAESVRILGVSRSVKLGYRDSGMAGSEANGDPRSFSQADLEEATGRLVRVIREERPQVLVTYDESGGYGHPDHVRAHLITVAGFEAAGDPARFPEAGPAWRPSKLYYTAFARSGVQRFGQMLREHGIEAPWSAPSGGDDGNRENTPSFGTPDELVTTVIDVSAYAGTKYQALLAHRTQLGTMEFFLQLPPELLQQWWSQESFVLTGAPAGAREDDLFQDLRD